MRTALLSKHRGLVMVWVAMLICVPVGALAIHPGQDWGGDFASYIAQGQSLIGREIHTYASDNLRIVTDSDVRPGPQIYPWGYPLSLVPVLAFWGHSLTAMKLENLFFYLCFLWAIYLLFAQRLSQLDMGGLLLLFALSPACVGRVDFVLSDLMFLTLSTLTLVAIDRWALPKSVPSSKYAPVLLGILLYLACLTRVNGVLLIAVLALRQWWESRRREGGLRVLLERDVAYIGTPYVAAFGLLAVTSVFLPRGEGSYLNSLGGLNLSSVIHNFLGYGASMKDLFRPLPSPTAALFLTAPFLLAGLVTAWRDDYWLIAYAGGTFVVYVIWPPDQGFRYLLPLVPVYAYVVIAGARHLIGRLQGKVARTAHAGLASMFILMAAAYTWYWTRAPTSMPGETDWRTGEIDWRTGPYSRVSQDAFAMVDETVPSRDAVGFFKPRILYLFTGRTGLVIDRPASLRKVQYYLWYRYGNHQSTHPQKFQIPRNELDRLVSLGDMAIMYSNDQFTLYRVRVSADRSGARFPE